MDLVKWENAKILAVGPKSKLPLWVLSLQRDRLKNAKENWVIWFFGIFCYYMDRITDLALLDQFLFQYASFDSHIAVFMTFYVIYYMTLS